MMSLAELWKHLKFASDYNNLMPSQRQILEPILYEEFQAREVRRISYLMKRSVLKRIKRIEDFDWTFNPKVPKKSCFELMALKFIRHGDNAVLAAVLIGPQKAVASNELQHLIWRHKIPIFTS